MKFLIKLKYSQIINQTMIYKKSCLKILKQNFTVGQGNKNRLFVQ